MFQKTNHDGFFDELRRKSIFMREKSAAKFCLAVDLGGCYTFQAFLIDLRQTKQLFEKKSQMFIYFHDGLENVCASGERLSKNINLFTLIKT